ncbi:GNAT family N-acetyltransferase [Janibacter melonis]|uniref:GNAT family N-acetyltransferase n=1 Tax=Janibacter melonis TaxID=262209 RepID=A0A650GF96_9MICO|nr:GNAT family N-acetyltransferase [Janibacter melonis]MCB5991942.1 GNAT family N-acetyltransferase [Janibacter melonis]QGX08582.1 GNAT family N-acetyltransferase [Janibacter melonis]
MSEGGESPAPGPADLEVRRAGPSDAGTVGLLLFDFNTEFVTPTPAAAVLAARFERLLEREDVVVLLAREGGEDIGFAYLTYRPTPYGDGPLVQLEELYVRPALRDEGVGAALLGRALDDAVAVGAVELDINVDAVDIDTRRFYERWGFSCVDPGTGDLMLCYIREL